MKTFCDYCGSAIDDTLDRCPNCGAVNQHMQRSGNQVPKTIEELQAEQEKLMHCPRNHNGRSRCGDVSVDRKRRE